MIHFSSITDGKLIAVGSSSCRWQPSYEFETHTHHDGWDGGTRLIISNNQYFPADFSLSTINSSQYKITLIY